MRIKSFFKIFGWLPLSILSFSALAEDNSNLATDVRVTVDITQYSNTNVSGGIGFDGGIRQRLYLHKFLGVFAGADYAIRTMDLNAPEKVKWLDLPFGVSFRYKGGNIEGMEGNFDLGLYYACNLTKTAKDVGIGDLKGGLGLYFAGESLFEITPSFQFGLTLSGKLGFSSPFKALARPMPFSAGIGLVGRMHY
jgi:hypothetical protein